METRVCLKYFLHDCSLTEKSIKGKKNLVENDKVISEESDLAEIFRNYFKNIVENLNIKRAKLSELRTDPVLNIIKRFEQHPSTLKIKDSVKQITIFSSQSVIMNKTLRNYLT